MSSCTKEEAERIRQSHKFLQAVLSISKIVFLFLISTNKCTKDQCGLTINDIPVIQSTKVRTKRINNAYAETYAKKENLHVSVNFHIFYVMTVNDRSVNYF